RLRAILMTSLTIAAALTPTAFQLGEGADLRAPLAATVLGGVISSTVLTLVVVPVMYTLLDGLHLTIGRRMGMLGTLIFRRRTGPPADALAVSATAIGPANGHTATNGVAHTDNRLPSSATDRTEA